MASPMETVAASPTEDSLEPLERGNRGSVGLHAHALAFPDEDRP